MPPETLKLNTSGWSNPTLPVLLFRAALSSIQIDRATALEAMFDRHGWPSQWRDGIYDFHHFHSNAHEALGVATGTARLRLGGPDGMEVAVHAGDVIVLPAGTGHFRIEASGDFLVVGAYPPEQQDFDICRGPADAAATRRIAAVAVPPTDPLGTKLRLWPAP